MAFQILKPEIANIRSAVWNTIKIRWQFWSLLIGPFIIGVIVGILFDWGFFIPIVANLLFLGVIFYVVIVWAAIKSYFWKQFAEINGWQYKSKGDPDRESGLMFRQGSGRHISNMIEGSIDGRQFRIFNYGFSTGPGKNKKVYDYIVFAFKFNGSFPHIYLNNKHNFYGISEVEKIPLPIEFEKKFSLSAPRKYEIEALEIFTPDILANLLDNGFMHDVEFVNQEILIFTDGEINTAEKLEEEFNRALELEDLLDEKLDKFRFQPIGDMPHLL